ncbi:hypothetical protein [Campylobacter estrildidarum]|uniref:Periplasmic protein n=1 Tax=Campylobacter estrildidarum TaxID=2510189 RepID=A0A4U7BE59_9BACT|nr:hypothetical protein [Campylobacter estrildidarum]TKX29928.1 hypothetical protein CQA69_07085 [Campylobacter estrildidarum]
MNFKVFSVIVGILIAVILILGGTYYYLFEYSKPNYSYTPTNNYETNTQSSTYEQNTYSNQSNSNYSNNSYNTPSYPNYTDNQKQEDKVDNNTTLNNQQKQNTSATNKVESNKKTEKKVENKKEITEEEKKAKIEALNKEIERQRKLLEQEKALKNTTGKNTKKHKPSVAEEYLTIGKDSRLEPQLSTEGMQVYILDGKFLSDYRINLLKEILAPIQTNAKDYNLAIFVKMLPKGEMKLTVYNKDIIFSDMRKAYKYISVDRIKPYMDNPQEIDSHIAREEKIKKISIQIKKEGKGSEFSKHIKSLKTGTNFAQYFFPFCEMVEISSK